MKAIYRGVAAFATIENRRDLKGKDAPQIDQIHRQISRLTAFLRSCLTVLPCHARDLREKPRSDDDSVPRTSRAKSTIKAFCDLLKCRADAAEERIGPPEGIRQQGVQFGMHWRKNGEARRKTPRVEPTMKGQEGSGMLPYTLPATTMTATTTRMTTTDNASTVLASDMPISET
ncbi:hypothetical protein G5I_03331 [Acromyrmex echinatior]|uniref:Uncharacterized protein n=1 Tax=Acromyrmex echinatior TaxID=103372 RepID=F4WCQ5_ACREC|nr:hypothetical protein G5I_03331 [Acromyrmex echinatior]